MRYLGLTLALGLFSSAAQDQSVPPPPPKPDKDAAWKKVVDLKSGTELRIFKVKQPNQRVLAKMDEGDMERLVVVVGNSQTAIPRDEIDRIDYRPPSPVGGGSSRMKVESQSKSSPPDTKNQSPGRLGSNNPRGSYESGSSVSFGGKPGFEPLYRRPR
jgi:hypothetical protein